MKYIVLSDIKNSICTLKINNPDKRNALSIAVRDEISDALDQIVGEPELKVVIIRGVGNMFSAGFDLGEFQKAAQDPHFHGRLWSSSDRFHHTVLNYPLPTIAAINGPAIAGGFDLATMCDMRIASSNAYFSHPEKSFGDVMYSPLHDILGSALARELILTGRKIDAREAARIRLVTKCVSQEKLDEHVMQMATEIAGAPRENLMNTKAKIIRRMNIPAFRTLDI
jgi:enoyl-CoA hydratase